MGIPTMIIRLLFSVASLAVALAGVVVVDCVNSIVEVLSSDPAGLCAVVEPLGVESGTWVGTGTVLIAVIAAFTIWVPQARRRSRRQLIPVVSLQSNLSRLVDHEHNEGESPPPGSDAFHTVRLTRRLEALESSLDVEAVATREATVQWMRLLREANDLHNQDEMTTEDFKSINTRLLDLFVPPSEKTRSEELTGSSP